MPKCLSCSKVNPTVSKFCSNCGSKLPVAPPTQEVPPRITEPSSISMVAYIAICIGGFFLLMGWSSIHTANQSEDLARGTIIEDDPFSNQLNENMRNSGYSMCATGLVICFGGIFVAWLGEKKSKESLEGVELQTDSSGE